MKKKYTFEEGMAELEQLVEAMEGGELTLEASFKAYEEGIKLSAALRTLLEEGDQRVLALKKTLDGIQEAAIDDEVAP